MQPQDSTIRPSAGELVPIASIQVGERFRRDRGDVRPLAASIAAIGLLHPIVLSRDGVLIAGERRLAACMHLGWESVPARIVDLDAVAQRRAQHDENVLRLPFQPSELAAIARALLPAERAAARERQGTRTDLPNICESFAEVSAGRSVNKAAAYAGVSGRTVEKAVAVVEAAEREPEKYQPLVQEMDSSGKVDRAYKRLRTAQAREAVATAAAELPPAPDDRYRLLTGDLLDAAAGIIADNSVDAIVTDPPYPEEYLPLYGRLATLAARVLKPGGSLVVMVGHAHLPALLGTWLVHPELHYQWTLCYLLGGPSAAVWSRSALVGWKPVLWFVKGTYAGLEVGDVCRSEHAEKAYHNWGQSESGFDALIHRFARAGDLILDPFVGGGACGVVALRRGCRFVGVDVDAAAIAQTAVRLAAVAAETA